MEINMENKIKSANGKCSYRYMKIISIKNDLLCPCYINVFF